ncbi:uncharacterized protein [Montipora capricornis]|uniref:uncharacterized protein n=1 Tax=Montipora capricornis TaxID=246305 RepID=UPI0035F1CF08
MDAIDPAKRASSPFVEFNSSDPLKALGVSWDSDHFRFLASSGIISSHDPMSKRSLLSLASKMFDPLGLISPFTVRAKILFQELWLKGLKWDDPLDSDTKAKWLSWKSESLQLKDVTIRIPRCFGNGITQDSVVEVHGFGDASPKAYGAAVYIRIRNKQDNVSSQLVISKSRVAPIKKVSLPRLELLAAVVNARLLKFVVGAFPMKVARVVCWSDSMVALHWIKRQSSSWKPFVANRVAEEVVYKEEFEKLKAGEVLPSNNRLLRLDPYYDRDDQVLRVGGRLQFADLHEQSKHQIILPQGHPEVAKMVQDVHKNMLHAGPETVLSTLRQKVWLTQRRRNDGLVRTATVRAHNSFYTRPVQGLHKFEIELAASQVSPEAEDPVHGGEKPQTNTVHAASIPVSKPNLGVVLPEGGQGGENVTARTRSGRVTKKPERLDL